MYGGLDPAEFSHIFDMLDDTRMRSGLYPFFHIALLNDFGSFASCDRLFESTHFSTDYLSVAVCCGVSPECTVAVEISYYDVRLVSLSQYRESEWFRWWFVHGVYNTR